jgi:hypothetical protein
MRWIATPQAGQMDAAMRTQVLLLREQINRDPAPAPEAPIEEDD